jgi:ABC-type hemin transport system substrate-binding protein
VCVCGLRHVTTLPAKTTQKTTASVNNFEVSSNRVRAAGGAISSLVIAANEELHLVGRSV